MVIKYNVVVLMVNYIRNKRDKVYFEVLVYGVMAEEFLVLITFLFVVCCLGLGRKGVGK